jgi:hypothetical protein
VLLLLKNHSTHLGKNHRMAELMLVLGVSMHAPFHTQGLYYTQLLLIGGCCYMYRTQGLLPAGHL